MYPIAFPLFPEIFSFASHHFQHHKGKVGDIMVWGVEVMCHWLVSVLVSDVTTMSIKANVEWILCFTNILDMAKTALN